jgi:hypothetical protein
MKTECPRCECEFEVDFTDDPFGGALSSYKSGRIIAMLDDLESALPSEFIGFADDILKWAGKTR